MIKRDAVLGTLYDCVDSGNTIFVFGAGSGLSARAAHMAGVHLISVYSTAILRMKGLNSLTCALPVANANQLLLDEGGVIVRQAGCTPCIAGIAAQDPFHPVGEMLDKVEKMGFCGVSNEPFAGIYGSWFADLLEEYGMGFSAELDMLRQAAERGLLTMGWAFDEEQACRLVENGIDIVGVMVMDGPGKYSAGKTEEERLREAVLEVRKMCQAALKINPQAILITHGDPFYDVKTATESLISTGAVGYASGSSGERLPSMDGIVKTCQEFLNM
ncbi:MAG: phosphoenolpyruvate hydrolase family protein [Ruminococcus sp.]|nr:phosphoenolpyruvate hydrolase family protein [Ruminococcus sp.]